MRREFPPAALVALLGAIAVGALHRDFADTWQLLYRTDLWGGARAFLREGVLDPWMEMLSRGLDAEPGPAGSTQLVFAGLALGLALLRGERELATGAVLWTGAMIPLLPLLAVALTAGGSALPLVAPAAAGELVPVALAAEPARVALAALAGGGLAAALRGLVGAIGSRR